MTNPMCDSVHPGRRRHCSTSPGPARRHAMGKHGWAAVGLAYAGAGLLALSMITGAAAQEAQTAPSPDVAAPGSNADNGSFFGTGLRVELGAGVRLAPAYEGAKKLTPGPLPLLDVEGLLGNRVSLSSERGLAVTVLNAKGFKAGMNLNYSEGRSHSDSDRLNGLPGIRPAAAIGGFLTYDFDPFSVELKVSDRLGPDSGATASLSGSYTFSPLQKLQVSFGPEVVFADHRYEETFFGVSPTAAANATAVGNPIRPYNAHAGVKDVGLSLTVRYAISEHWIALAHVGLSELVGSAARSPLTQTRFQPSVLAGLAYRF